MRTLDYNEIKYQLNEELKRFLNKSFIKYPSNILGIFSIEIYYGFPTEEDFALLIINLEPNTELINCPQEYIYDDIEYPIQVRLAPKYLEFDIDEF